MSDSDPIDLSDLQLKPQWIDELDKPNRFEAFEGKEDRRPRQGNRDRRPGRRPDGGGGGGGQRRGPGGDRRGPGGDRRGPGGDRRRSPGGGTGGDRERGPRGDRPPRGGGQRRQGDRPPRRGDGPRGPRPQNRPERPPLYELMDIELFPDEAGLDAVARQIKMTGRSYPIFDLARLALGGPERYHARFTLKPETTQVELIECRLDQSVWLSMNEALRHFRQCGLFDQYYKKEEVEVDPPKGNFSVIAVCGLSGEMLGPPNFHSYQKNLNDLHARKFSRMHIDGYKRRIEMVRDEETIQKWKDSLAKETHYTYLKAPEGEEAPVFKSFAEAERHFVDKHGEEAFAKVTQVTVPGTIPPKKISGALLNMMKRNVERQTKFPMPMVKNVSPAMEKAGLRFFKLGKKETYVARSRPRAFNAKTEVSPRIRSIVQYIRDNEKQDLHKLVTALVPNASTQEGTPTPEEIDFLKDLRWLIREGFVIEFSSGELRLGSDKAPLPPASRAASPAASTKGKPAGAKASPAADPAIASKAQGPNIALRQRMIALKKQRRTLRRGLRFAPEPRHRKRMKRLHARGRLRRLGRLGAS